MLFSVLSTVNLFPLELHILGFDHKLLYGVFYSLRWQYSQTIWTRAKWCKGIYIELNPRSLWVNTKFLGNYRTTSDIDWPKDNLSAGDERDWLIWQKKSSIDYWHSLISFTTLMEGIPSHLLLHYGIYVTQ